MFAGVTTKLAYFGKSLASTSAISARPRTLAAISAEPSCGRAPAPESVLEIVPPIAT